MTYETIPRQRVKPRLLQRFGRFGEVLAAQEISLAAYWHQASQQLLIAAPQHILKTRKLMAPAWLAQFRTALQTLLGSVTGQQFPVKTESLLAPRYTVVPSEWVQPSLRQYRQRAGNRMAGQQTDLLYCPGCRADLLRDRARANHDSVPKFRRQRHEPGVRSSAQARLRPDRLWCRPGSGQNWGGEISEWFNDP